MHPVYPAASVVLGCRDGVAVETNILCPAAEAGNWGDVFTNSGISRKPNR